jgi:parallel beta-helix repeat protein
VSIENLTVEGTYSGGYTNVNGNLLGLHAGIYVSNGGSATITHNLVTDIRDAVPNTNVDDGFGILIGSSPTVLNTTGSALIAYNTVTNYQSVGIDVAHSGSNATIRNNTVLGLGQALGNQYTQQIGIRAETGATATITGNAVSRNVQTTPGSAPYGIELLGSGLGVIVGSNTVTGNTDGIVAISLTGGTIIDANRVTHNSRNGIVLASSSGVTLAVNLTSSNGSTGIDLFGSTNNTVEQNFSLENGFDGIFVDSGSTGNQFLQNTLNGNGFDDAGDFSIGLGTAGTGNTWSQNSGTTDNKGGGLFQ